MESLRDIDVYNFVIDVKYKKLDSNVRLGITRILRDIHDKELFGMTDKLKSVLKEYNLYQEDYIKKTHRTKYNRELKKLGFDDEIMIEHMIAVRVIVDGMFDLTLDDSMDIACNQMRKYIEDNTHCIAKLKNTEHELQGDWRK